MLWCMSTKPTGLKSLIAVFPTLSAYFQSFKKFYVQRGLGDLVSLLVVFIL
jgi:hypothetical protein